MRGAEYTSEDNPIYRSLHYLHYFDVDCLLIPALSPRFINFAKSLVIMMDY